VRVRIAWPRSSRSFGTCLSFGVSALPKRSWVKISQIRTLSVERIGARLGRAAPEELSQVVDNLNEIIGI
jgi:mRNA interferase MazF